MFEADGKAYNTFVRAQQYAQWLSVCNTQCKHNVCFSTVYALRRRKSKNLSKSYILYSPLPLPFLWFPDSDKDDNPEHHSHLWSVSLPAVGLFVRYLQVCLWHVKHLCRAMTGLFNLTAQCFVALNVLLLPLLRRWMKKGNRLEGNLLGLSCSYLCQRPDEMHWMKTEPNISLWSANASGALASCNWEINMSVIIIINCVRGIGIAGFGLVHLFLHITLIFLFPLPAWVWLHVSSREF